jgi:hypothetical protein
MIDHVRGRRSLLWLIVPFVLFVFAMPLANRIDPVILSPLAIWLAARRDPYFQADEPERTDVD